MRLLKSKAGYIVYVLFILAYTTGGYLLITLSFDYSVKMHDEFTYAFCRMIVFIMFGLILGADYIFGEFRKDGRWRIKRSKIIILCLIPTYLAACFILEYSESLNSLVVPFLKGLTLTNDYLAPAIDIFLGYTIISSFHKIKTNSDTSVKSCIKATETQYKTAGMSIKILKNRTGYIIYILFILSYLAAGYLFIAWADFERQKMISDLICVFCRLIVFIMFGYILGASCLFKELKKDGKWKVNSAKIVLLGLPSAYMIICAIAMWSYNNITLPFMNSLNPVYYEIFPIIGTLLGYTIISSFYKVKIDGD